MVKAENRKKDSHTHITTINRPMPEEQETPILIKVNVKGVKFEIQCRESQLKNTIDKVMSAITEYTYLPVTLKKKRLIRAATCTDALRKLILEGWFDSPRTLPEVHSEIVERGFHYGRGVVGHSLLELTKENSLKREGQPRRYRYTTK